MIGVYCRGDIAVLIYMQMIASDEDKSKFEQIYLTYRKLMFFVARSILKNDADAEDAVHTAFVSIIEHLKKYLKSTVRKRKLLPLLWRSVKRLIFCGQKNICQTLSSVRRQQALKLSCRGMAAYQMLFQNYQLGIEK